jgi:hypothetical protein
MDTSLKKDTVSENPKGVNNDPPTRLDIPVPVEAPKIARMSLLTDPPVPPDIPAPVIPDPVVDIRIARMRLNTGNSERFDKLAQQVIEDVKTMSWTAAFRKNGIPIGSVGRLRRRWEHMGLITTTKKQEAKIIAKKENGASKYDHLLPQIMEDLKTMNSSQCEKKNGIPGQSLFNLLNRWKLSGKIPVHYKPPIRGIMPHSIQRSNNTNKGTKRVHEEVKQDTLPTYICPYCETNRTQADALIKHLEAVHYAPPKMALPLWCEAWGDSVKVAWLHVLEITGIR